MLVDLAGFCIICAGLVVRFLQLEKGRSSNLRKHLNPLLLFLILKFPMKRSGDFNIYFITPTGVKIFYC